MVIGKVNRVWPQFYAMPDIIRSSGMNPNLRHLPIMLLNVGWLETTKGDFLFWKDGCSPHVAKVMKAIDDERMSVIQALGFETIPIGFYNTNVAEWQNTPKKLTSSQYYEDVQNLPFAPIARAGRIWDEGYGDHPFKYRYLEEDAAYVYVPIAGLGRVTSTPTPTTDALVSLACAVNEIDYWREGRNLERLGIGALTVQQIERYIRTGVY
jgi:opine dehydrogenase